MSEIRLQAPLSRIGDRTLAQRPSGEIFLKLEKFYLEKGARVQTTLTYGEVEKLRCQ